MQWYSYLVGYLVIIIEGPSPERVINQALIRGFFLWDIRSLEEDKIILKIRLNAFRPLRHLVRQYEGRMRIAERRGMPFHISKMKKRKILVIGAVLFLISLYLLSSFVWTIEISGNEKLSSTELLEIAYQYGLEPGVSIYNLEIEKLEKQIREANPKIAWVGISVHGTKVTIEIAEKVLIPETDNNRANLIAKADGIVDQILVLVGRAQVQEGEKVQKGQILINGEIYPEIHLAEDGQVLPLGQPEFVRARGLVRALIEHSVVSSCPIEEEIITPTGKKERQIFLIYEEKEIIIEGPREIPFREFQMETTAETFLNWRDIDLPVELVIKEYREIKKEIIYFGYEGAYQEAIQRGEKVLRGLLSKDSKLVQKKIVVNPQVPENRQIVEVKIIWQCLEDIAVPLEF